MNVRDYDYTPSEAYDSARHDAGHDEMQLAVLNMVMNDKGLPIPTRSVIKQLNDGVREESKISETDLTVRTKAEMMFSSEGRRSFFVDVCQTYTNVKPNYNGIRECRFIAAYELKPKIYSCGAIIRQIQMLRQRLFAWSPYGCRVIVIPVLFKNDPKLDLFSQMCDAFIWEIDPL